ncbi:MAG: hypothetical protein RLZZ29_517, partial [Cyanobacteriota bacterium]
LGQTLTHHPEWNPVFRFCLGLSHGLECGSKVFIIVDELSFLLQKSPITWQDGS